MAHYSAIKAAVNAYIKQNGRKEITGRILNAVLNATIDSLGRYFQFAGGALPTDDPGTPDQNVCYLAGEPGVYTNFGGITIENEEVALLFWDGEWTKQRILIGIREVNASVDNQVGTPSVDVSYSGGELVLTFHNLKGEQGDTGDPAGFGTIGADINGGVGTPGVSVETSGDNTAKNLMFHFTNLKGETGVTSVVATIDNTSGTPSCQVSMIGQQLTLAFSGLKGLKGDTGVSADYPITIYNGLDSDATDQALAAYQGKVLDGKVSQLRQEVTADVSQLEAKVDDLFADSQADLDIADEDGNVIARFQNGHIKTKNFDSSETTRTANGAAGDLDICDESGNIVARFKDGNIKTKNFDSSRFQQADDICDFIENSFHTGRFKFDRVTIWDYYAAYDELCDFRQILVKESPIGFSTLPSEDRATKDPNQYPINLYRIPNTSARKRIVLMGAIHGDSQFTDANPTGEDWYGDHGDAQENILAPYYFVCDLIRHKDDNPEYKLLLQEYEIDIIPILNPWGVQNHSRRNGNNVDLNRNFDATDSQGNSRWQNQTQGNKGASPFSENETQAIVSYINSHNDIHLVVECHARGEVNLGGDNRFYAVCPDGVPIQQGITDAVNAAKAKFGAQGGLHPYTRDEVPATCYAWIFFEKGIPTFEPELGQSIGRRFFFNVKMSTAKRLNINDVYTITTTVPDFVVTFRVVASDGSDEAMVLGDTYALLYNGTYRCGNDTITIASNTVMDAPSRHCKELLYSMFWYYRKLVFETL